MVCEHVPISSLLSLAFFLSILWQELPGISKSVSDALDKLCKALLTVPEDFSKDPELEAYVATAHFRQNLGEIFRADTAEIARGFLVDGGSTTTGTGLTTPVSTHVEAMEDESQKEPSASPQHATEQPGSKMLPLWLAPDLPFAGFPHQPTWAKQLVNRSLQSSTSLGLARMQWLSRISMP